MRNKSLVIIGGGQGKCKPFRGSLNKITGPQDIKNIEKSFLERLNRLADNCFSTVPFDEDMWNYLHELRQEILWLAVGLCAGKEFIAWNDQGQVKDYCESIHGKLTKCEKQFGFGLAKEAFDYYQLPKSGDYINSGDTPQVETM